jgi:hypothetical protein
MDMIRALSLGISYLAIIACSHDPYQGISSLVGHSRYDLERDYMECDYKAKMANTDMFYSRTSPAPFGPGPQSPADHARALHGLSTINAMRDTCLAAKGYRVE